MFSAIFFLPSFFFCQLFFCHLFLLTCPPLTDHPRVSHRHPDFHNYTINCLQNSQITYPLNFTIESQL
ncbi:hypothetical protein MEK_02479 [Candida albicans 12C]|nr:hypothetical protein MEK_02479 [Candida albicans 12C]KHC65022.1 hypothetical protein MGE_02470 [Candida albicans P75010]